MGSLDRRVNCVNFLVSENGGKKESTKMGQYSYWLRVLIIELLEMGKKEKCPSCSKGWCKNHVFELNPIRKNLYFRKALKLRMCPRLNKNSHWFEKTFPVINKDRKFYTPTFILEEQQNFYSENDARIKQNHLDKAQNQASGTSEMELLFLSSLTQLVPKHGRKKNYCSVCKDDFEDYLDHISSDSHKKQVRANKYSGYILEFCHKYKEKQQSDMKERLRQPDATEAVIDKKLSIGRSQETHENSQRTPLKGID